ncbi:elongation factor G [Gorillibacterium timonense]|uniref:elongation factor G n=1 Tax=Gorillibacterium timonense TaxID=1689269 RepID=UPI00071D9EFF|nr:TetM/TetW/TetO/TetS family tetracycline resistance ribosomal protection protein [Gorillibacterium timonense]
MIANTSHGAGAPLQKRLRNVGVFAHVDAGKTTTTEQMLYASGRIRTLGSVDAGTAQTDFLDVERERGISVRAAVTRLEWGDTLINLVDTPGHVDFLAEVERSLSVMDGAILIVSAVEGVQAQTEVIWDALCERGLPALIYVNKMDRIGADPEGTLRQIHRVLGANAAPLQAPCGAEGGFAGVAPLAKFLDGGGGIASEEEGLVLPSDKCLRADEGREVEEGWEVEPYRTLLLEAAAEADEELLVRYLEEGEIGANELASRLPELTRRRRIVPVLFGASARGIGVRELLDGLARLLPCPSGDPTSPLAGVVFKLEKDPAMGRIAYVRLYEGTIRNRDSVHNQTQELAEKATQIRRVEGRRSEDLGILEAGDIAAVYGLSRARIGDVLGAEAEVPGGKTLAVPLLTVQVEWPPAADYMAVVAAFQELADEDPLLDLQWIKEDRELHLKVMGPIQIEVLTELVKSRFGLDVRFGAPSVIYKETPARTGEGFIAYTMPKPCWAILRFLIEPGERGSGIVYRSLARPERLLESYQNEVARRVPEALQQGLFGWEVTDVKVTLLEGEHHVWHTHPLDFVVATPMGIMNGLAETGVRLLEPMLRFRLSVPEEFGGKLMNELVVMRGEFSAPELHGERMEITGTVPLATSLDFPARIGSLTKGRGIWSSSYAGYRECPPDVHAERARRGVNPLDQAKYILAARSALS